LIMAMYLDLTPGPPNRLQLPVLKPICSPAWNLRRYLLIMVD
jgi:hypothetical protein